MKPRSLLRAAVPVALAFGALVVRERTRVPFVELPAPGTARVFAPPTDLVRAALGSRDGEFRVSPDRDQWFVTPASDRLAELYRPVEITAGSLRVDEGVVRLELDLEIHDDRFREPLQLRFEPAALRPSVVPGARSAEIGTTARRGDEQLEISGRLHLLALGQGTARALLVAEVVTAYGVGSMVLELVLERP